MNNFKITCNMNYFLNYNSIHRYQAEKWVAYIQTIDKNYIIQYKILNILQLLEHILSYVYLNFGINYCFKNEPKNITSMNPINIFISMIDLLIEDDNESIRLNNYYLEYNNKKFPKYNITYYIPINLIKYDNTVINKQLYNFINRYKHIHYKINNINLKKNKLKINYLKMLLIISCLFCGIIVLFKYNHLINKYYKY